MKTIYRRIIVTQLLLLNLSCLAQTSSNISSHLRLKPISVTEINFTNGFWAHYQEALKTGAIESVWQGLNDTLNSAGFRNFFIAAGLQKGKSYNTNWSDGDCYKWIEAASYVYLKSKDASIKNRMDTIIKVIGMAQEPDGYLQSYNKINNSPRWQKRINHEDYNLGHLFTAGSVNYTLTGDTLLLYLAKKAADNLYTKFIAPPREFIHFGWNPSHIMGLVDLYRVTYDKRYLALADTFLNIRGRNPEYFTKQEDADIAPWLMKWGGDQNQNRIPLRKEFIAVGHVVTGMYLYSGAADIYAETGDATLLNALEIIWKDLVTKKIYITGGAAAYHGGVSIRGDEVHEAFGNSYDLPEANAYNETCSNISIAMFNQRMLNITANAKYADLMEKILYNSMLSSASLDATRFFYCNPLRYSGNPDRMSFPNDVPNRWHRSGCYCCPPSFTRALAFMPGWAYSTSTDGVWVNIYGSNNLTHSFDGKISLNLEQTTQFPWDGNIQIKVTSAPKTPLSINLRIPGWVKPEIKKVKIKINGVEKNLPIEASAYIPLKQVWKSGDVIELFLPMEIHLIQANPEVEQARGQLAVQRGPVVYCIEDADIPSNIDISQITLEPNALFTEKYEPDLLGGIVSITTDSFINPLVDYSESMYAPVEASLQKIKIKLVPYYTWANRGVHKMQVWNPKK